MESTAREALHATLPCSHASIRLSADAGGTTLSGEVDWPYQKERAFGGHYALGRFIYRGIARHGIVSRVRRNDRFGGLFLRNILGQLQQDRTGPLLLGSSEALPHQ